MKKTKTLLIAVGLLTSLTSHAQFENFLKGGVEDANLLLNNYMSPFLKGMGYGFNNGWYNTAKPHETLGFDITFSVNAAIVPVADQSFVFDPAKYNNTRIASGPTTLPTIAGSPSTTVLENYITDPNLPPPGEVVLGSYNAPDGVGDDIKTFTFNQVAVPSPIIQIGVGIIKGTEVKVRWLPNVDVGSVKVKYWGLGGMHSISQWIPGLKDMDFLDISAFVAYTKISSEYDIPDGDAIAGVNQLTSFEVNTLTYQLVASAKISVLTGYIGLGMDNYKTNFRMLGTYDLYPGNTIIPPEYRVLEDPINLEASGQGGFRTTMGVRLKLAIITLHADYTFREYNTITAGLGFSFR